MSRATLGRTKKGNRAVPFFYSALVTAPERMQRVQTLMVRTVPLLTAFTFCRFGRQSLRVLLCAWLMLLPVTGFFPQISQILAISISS